MSGWMRSGSAQPRSGNMGAGGRTCGEPLARVGCARLGTASPSSPAGKTGAGGRTALWGGKMDQKELPKRKRPAHMPPLERHDRPVILFVTLAVQPRGDYLASELFHAVFLDACRDADTWLVGRYVIMPDHIHLFCTPSRQPAVSLRRWIQYLKERITKRLGAALSSAETTRCWCWQADCWDTQVRSGEHYHERWLYVSANPVRAGLVDYVEKWAFQGELNVLRWS